ncbi:MAG: tRNA (adenosine(37)-N6)-dimethylallyltransferase MiaA [Dehalococcoidia bacterium]|nr:MAG: tRNA (adenosine(37)-N6)-dimethylallyltransferase MiaA [Dehalococcoidia bacterium]
MAIIGPTAIGKSSLALELSQTLSGEIINADSRQVYRNMDIGTAKPTREEREQVPHHLLDVVFPDQQFNLALYQKKALKAIKEMKRRWKPPFLVGGSGLYVWALLEGWNIPPVPPDPIKRRELEERAQVEGAWALYEELKQLNPVAAERIDPKNARRIIRALEVSQLGDTFSAPSEKKHPFDSLVIGLTTDRNNLYRKIDNRVDGMMKRGLLAEVEELVAKGYGFELPSMSALGYKQIGMFLQGIISLSEAVQQIKYNTHRFVRHQYNWFRLQDKRIHWFDAKEKTRQGIKDLIQRFLADHKVGS